jgi:molecular chaperone DnaJ
MASDNDPFLESLETIPLADAVLGAMREVPTLNGKASVSVPPGTQPDALLRLKGKGLPEFGGGRRGDLYLRIQVHVPEKLSQEERRLFERLRVLEEGQQHTSR